MTDNQKKLRNVIIVCLLFAVMLLFSFNHYNAQEEAKAKADGISERCQKCLAEIGIKTDITNAIREYEFRRASNTMMAPQLKYCTCNCTRLCEVESWMT